MREGWALCAGVGFTNTLCAVIKGQEKKTINRLTFAALRDAGYIKVERPGRYVLTHRGALAADGNSPEIACLSSKRGRYYLRSR